MTSTTRLDDVLNTLLIAAALALPLGHAIVGHLTPAPEAQERAATGSVVTATACLRPAANGG